MADLATNAPRGPAALWRALPKAWLVVLAILLAVALADPVQVVPSLRGTANSVAATAPYIAFAVLAVAYMRASGAEAVVASAFCGPAWRMIVLAGVVGGVAPFCSCEVIPFVAALLAAGVPLGAVMALWLSSPLMDPGQFAITAGALGFEFAIAKTVAAISLGILGGMATHALAGTALTADPLRPKAAGGCGCGNPFRGRPVWRFWKEAKRRAAFGRTFLEQGHFLLKWLTLAYLLETLMIAYVPASAIGQFLGGDGFGTVLLASLFGAPAYLNGYAAAPLIGGLVEQGMAQGAAMAFMLAGGVSSIPAAVAVWALVKGRVFGLYLALAFAGSLGAGLVWGALA